MLDQLVYGDAERLAADAPVPVLHVRRTESNAGGSANVCLNLRALRANVSAFGVIGSDAAGVTLAASLRAAGVDVSGLVTEPDRPTTLKQNLVGLAQARHPQKMFRLDFESREPLLPDTTHRLLGIFRSALPGADVVCIEDYAKGVCSPEFCRQIIDLARQAGKPVFVDPARIADYTRYRRATVITPNRTEAEFATGIEIHDSASAEHCAALATRLLTSLELDACVLTLDRHGAMLLPRDGQPLSVPTVARQVYDVTGAGDMFLAALAAARANSIGWHDAVRFANAAAGLEVEVFGVQPIPLERVHHALLVESGGLSGKVRTLDQLLVEVDARRRAGQKVVFTNGCFDVLHAGHVWLLDQARSEGDFLIAATNTDERIREYKGPNRPVNNVDDRVRVLAGLAAVDAVLVFPEDTPYEAILRLRPDVLVKGDEYSADRIPGAAFVESYGGRVVRVAMMPGSSSTQTLRKLGDPRAAVTPQQQAESRFVRDPGAAQPAAGVPAPVPATRQGD